MRLRYRSVSYSFGGTPDEATSSVEKHFRELRGAMLQGGSHYPFSQSGAAWRPPMDIRESPHEIQLKIELAGVSEDTIHITLYENALLVTGLREDDADDDQSVCYHEAQVRYGPFRADVVLLSPIQHEAIEATYHNGFLRIRLPKREKRPNQFESTDSATQAKPSVAQREEPSSPPSTTSQASTLSVTIARLL